MRETWVRSLGQEDPLEKKMATHSSTLAWGSPWTEKPCRLQSMGLQRVRHNWVTSLSLFQYKDYRFNPWSGSKVPTCLSAKKKKKELGVQWESVLLTHMIWEWERVILKDSVHSVLQRRGNGWWACSGTSPQPHMLYHSFWLPSELALVWQRAREVKPGGASLDVGG